MSSSRIESVFVAALLACTSARGAEIHPRVIAEAQQHGTSDAVLVFSDQSTPLLSPLSPEADYHVRRRALVEALRARADASQDRVRRWLDARGIAHRDYWIANVIEAHLPASALPELAQRVDVARVEPNTIIARHLPSVDSSLPMAAPDAAGIAWGVAKIGAPAVWALGFTGQGVILGGEDTGIQWNHPALEPQYNGWNGTTADHNYNWHDAIHNAVGNPCGNDSPVPCDDNSHGTHTAGTFAGDDHAAPGSRHQIGVAPGARWIGCRNMDRGAGTPARYIECMQWMLAPTNLAGQNPDPDRGADIVSNSWSCPAAEGCTLGTELANAVNNLVAGGVFYAAAAQNAGPGCSTIVDPPAIYDAAFVVGATDITDALADFSSRGPVSQSMKTRPDLSAPGVDVYSSVPTSTYGTKMGTSMATPHVAGAAALLMSAYPQLHGRPDTVAEILRASAQQSGVTDPVSQQCGDNGSTPWPNDMIGYGRLDVYAAILAYDEIFKDDFDGG